MGARGAPPAAGVARRSTTSSIDFGPRRRVGCARRDHRGAAGRAGGRRLHRRRLRGRAGPTARGDRGDRSTRGRGQPRVGHRDACRPGGPVARDAAPAVRAASRSEWWCWAPSRPARRRLPRRSPGGSGTTWRCRSTDASGPPRGRGLERPVAQRRVRPHRRPPRVMERRRRCGRCRCPCSSCDTDVLATALWHERYVGASAPRTAGERASRRPRRTSTSSPGTRSPSCRTGCATASTSARDETASARRSPAQDVPGRGRAPSPSALAGDPSPSIRRRRRPQAGVRAAAGGSTVRGSSARWHGRPADIGWRACPTAGRKTASPTLSPRERCGRDDSMADDLFAPPRRPRTPRRARREAAPGVLLDRQPRDHQPVLRHRVPRRAAGATFAFGDAGAEVDLPVGAELLELRAAAAADLRRAAAVPARSAGRAAARPPARCSWACWPATRSRDVRRAIQHGQPQMTIADLLGNPLPRRPRQPRRAWRTSTSPGGSGCRMRSRSSTSTTASRPAPSRRC